MCNSPSSYFAQKETLDGIESLNQIKNIGVCFKIVHHNPEFRHVFESIFGTEKLNLIHGKCQASLGYCIVNLNDKNYKAKDGLTKLDELVPELRDLIKITKWQTEDF